MGAVEVAIDDLGRIGNVDARPSHRMVPATSRTSRTRSMRRAGTHAGRARSDHREASRSSGRSVIERPALMSMVVPPLVGEVRRSSRRHMDRRRCDVDGGGSSSGPRDQRTLRRHTRPSVDHFQNGYTTGRARRPWSVTDASPTIINCFLPGNRGPRIERWRASSTATARGIRT